METLARVILTANSGLPTDDATTQLAFDPVDQATATLDGIAASIVSFYNTVNTGSTDPRPMGNYISNSVSRFANACAIQFYDISSVLGGGPAGSPIYVVPFTLAAAATGVPNYPAEVAVAFSFLAAGWATVPETAPNPAPPPATIRPRARYRGRSFFGPLVSSVGPTVQETADPVPSANFRSNAGIAWFRFLDERGGDFCTWSREDATLRLIAGAPGTEGSVTVDNAFDTIRSRGREPSVRTILWP